MKQLHHDPRNITEPAAGRLGSGYPPATDGPEGEAPLAGLLADLLDQWDDPKDESALWAVPDGKEPAPIVSQAALVGRLLEADLAGERSVEALPSAFPTVVESLAPEAPPAEQLPEARETEAEPTCDEAAHAPEKPHEIALLPAPMADIPPGPPPESTVPEIRFPLLSAPKFAGLGLSELADRLFRDSSGPPLTEAAAAGESIAEVETVEAIRTEEFAETLDADPAAEPDQAAAADPAVETDQIAQAGQIIVDLHATPEVEPATEAGPAAQAEHRPEAEETVQTDPTAEAIGEAKAEATAGQTQPESETLPRFDPELDAEELPADAGLSLSEPAQAEHLALEAETVESQPVVPAEDRELVAMLEAMEGELGKRPAAVPEPQPQPEGGLDRVSRAGYAPSPLAGPQLGAGDRYVVFELADNRFAVPLASVVETEKLPRITPVPGLPEFIRGVFNLRGEIIPLVDLRILLGMEPHARPEEGRMLVLRTGRSPLPSAFAVDGLQGLAAIRTEDLAAAPALLDGQLQRLIAGIGEHKERLVPVLDIEKLFADTELSELVA